MSDGRLEREIARCESELRALWISCETPSISDGQESKRREVCERIIALLELSGADGELYREAALRVEREPGVMGLTVEAVRARIGGENA